MRSIHVDGEELLAWIGPDFDAADPKLLVLGESRYDEDFTDRKIIEWRIAGKFKGGQRRTYTNFERAVLGQEHSEAEMQSFWNRTVFYNYNRTFYPGGPRVRLSYAIRRDPQNGSTLQTVLRELKPTHAIVWGRTNWDSIDTGPEWTDDRIQGTQEPCGYATIDRHRILFTRVQHPSAGFSSRYWGPVLSRFLASGRP